MIRGTSTTTPLWLMPKIGVVFFAYKAVIAALRPIDQELDCGVVEDRRERKLSEIEEFRVHRFDVILHNALLG